MSDKQLRIVTFNVLDLAFNLFTRWISETGNKHVLAVTTPGPTTRLTPQYRGIVQAAPRNVDVLITTRLRTVATPLIRALEPDLIMCFSFPYRLPSELTAIPKIGAVNLHPAVLPSYRGPNVFRMFYEDWHEYGVTIHWMDDDFDTGNILSQSRIPMPQEINADAIFEDWFEKGYGALKKGMAKAIAGDEGTVQDNSQASYAARYTEEEKWLVWSETIRTVQLKHLGLFGEAKAYIDDKAYEIATLIPENKVVNSEVGTVVAQSDNSLVVQVADGCVRVTVEPLDKS